MVGFSAFFVTACEASMEFQDDFLSFLGRWYFYFSKVQFYAKIASREYSSNYIPKCVLRKVIESVIVPWNSDGSGFRLRHPFLQSIHHNVEIILSNRMIILILSNQAENFYFPILRNNDRSLMRLLFSEIYFIDIP